MTSATCKWNSKYVYLYVAPHWPMNNWCLYALHLTEQARETEMTFGECPSNNVIIFINH